MNTEKIVRFIKKIKIMTIAKQLGIKKFPFKILQEGRVIYWESGVGDWIIQEYNDQGKPTYFKNNHGYETHRTYDQKGRMTSFKDSNGINTHLTYTNYMKTQEKQQPEETMFSLYEYLGKAAGSELGKQVVQKAIQQHVKVTSHQVSNPKYEGRILRYPISFLKEYFNSK